MPHIRYTSGTTCVCVQYLSVKQFYKKSKGKGFTVPHGESMNFCNSILQFVHDGGINLHLIFSSDKACFNYTVRYIHRKEDTGVHMQFHYDSETDDSMVQFRHRK
jgi:hypothetical protein